MKTSIWKANRVYYLHSRSLPRAFKGSDVDPDNTGATGALRAGGSERMKQRRNPKPNARWQAQR